MKCSRCDALHTPDNQLVSTEHGLLCSACMRVVEAAKQWPYGRPPILIDEDGPIIDPLYNPYEEARTWAPKRDFMQEAYEKTLRELTRSVIDAEKPVSVSEMTLNTLANYGLKEHFQKCLDDAGKRVFGPLVARWNEEDNG